MPNKWLFRKNDLRTAATAYEFFPTPLQPIPAPEGESYFSEDAVQFRERYQVSRQSAARFFAIKTGGEDEPFIAMHVRAAIGMPQRFRPRAPLEAYDISLTPVHFFSTTTELEIDRIFMDRPVLPTRRVAAWVPALVSPNVFEAVVAAEDLEIQRILLSPVFPPRRAPGSIYNLNVKSGGVPVISYGRQALAQPFFPRKTARSAYELSGIPTSFLTAADNTEIQRVLLSPVFPRRRNVSTAYNLDLNSGGENAPNVFTTVLPEIRRVLRAANTAYWLLGLNPNLLEVAPPDLGRILLPEQAPGRLRRLPAFSILSPTFPTPGEPLPSGLGFFSNPRISRLAARTLYRLLESTFTPEVEPLPAGLGFFSAPRILRLNARTLFEALLSEIPYAAQDLPAGLGFLSAPRIVRIGARTLYDALLSEIPYLMEAPPPGLGFLSNPRSLRIGARTLYDALLSEPPYLDAGLPAGLGFISTPRILRIPSRSLYRLLESTFVIPNEGMPAGLGFIQDRLFPRRRATLDAYEVPWRLILPNAEIIPAGLGYFSNPMFRYEMVIERIMPVGEFNFSSQVSSPGHDIVLFGDDDRLVSLTADGSAITVIFGDDGRLVVLRARHLY